MLIIKVVIPTHQNSKTIVNEPIYNGYSYFILSVKNKNKGGMRT